MSLHLKSEFERAFKIATFDPHMMAEVAKEKAALPLAILFIVLASFAGALGAYVFPLEYGLVIYQPTAVEALWNGVSAMIWIFSALFILHLIANGIFKAKGSFHPFLRVVGYGYVIGLLHFFPILSVLVGLWGLVLVFVILKNVKKLSTKKAAFSLLLLIIILGIFFTLHESINPANLYGGLYVVPF